MNNPNMTGDEWKKQVYEVVYAAEARRNFGHKTNIVRKADATINKAINEFLKIYPHSRRYETRRYNRENNTKNGTFLDVIKDDPMRRSIFYCMLVDLLGEEAPIKEWSGNVLVDIIRPLAEIRHDKSKGYNATLRLVYGKMPVCWKNRMTRTGLTKKSEIILGDKKLQKLFRATVEKMLEEINAE